MNSPVFRIISSYSSPIIRLYCRIRFQIIHQRFLYEIGQYLPERGRVLDCGCGFGLFSLFFSMLHPERTIHGFDLNARRIEEARRAATTLGLNNVSYWAEDVRSFSVTEKYDAVYMLDILHHIPISAVAPLLARVHEILGPSGTLIVKDVTDRPFWKRWFTWILDKAMDPKTPVNYWSQDALRKVLREAGFQVYSHEMVDYLPYPHILYVCRKESGEANSKQG